MECLSFFRLLQYKTLKKIVCARICVYLYKDMNVVIRYLKWQRYMLFKFILFYLIYFAPQLPSDCCGVGQKADGGRAGGDV